MELACDPCNVQVAQSKDKDNKSFILSDHEGMFLTINLGSEREHRDSGLEDTCDHESFYSPDLEEKGNELETMFNERVSSNYSISTTTGFRIL